MENRKLSVAEMLAAARGKPVADKGALKQLIIDNEDEYEISIQIKAKHRCLPTIGVKRNHTEGEEEPAEGEDWKMIVVPNYQWSGKLSESCCEEVNNDLMKLIELSKKFGKALCD